MLARRNVAWRTRRCNGKPKREIRQRRSSQAFSQAHRSPSLPPTSLTRPAIAQTKPGERSAARPALGPPASSTAPDAIAGIWARKAKGLSRASSAGAPLRKQMKSRSSVRSPARAHELPPPGVRVQQDGGASAARRVPADMPAATPEGDRNPGASAGPADSVARSLVASRWPEPSTADLSVNPAPEASTTMVADASPTSQAESPPAPAPVTPVAAAAPAEAPNSLQMLLLVILSAGAGEPGRGTYRGISGALVQAVPERYGKLAVALKSAPLKMDA